MIDVFDISAAVDILGKFGPEWIEEAKGIAKWNERVEKIKEICTAADVPKLATGNYFDIFEYLKKECGHSNVNVQ